MQQGQYNFEMKLVSLSSPLPATFSDPNLLSTALGLCDMETTCADWEVGGVGDSPPQAGASGELRM